MTLEEIGRVHGALPYRLVVAFLPSHLPLQSHRLGLGPSWMLRMPHHEQADGSAPSADPGVVPVGQKCPQSLEIHRTRPATATELETLVVVEASTAGAPQDGVHLAIVHADPTICIGFQHGDPLPAGAIRPNPGDAEGTTVDRDSAAGPRRFYPFEHPVLPRGGTEIASAAPRPPAESDSHRGQVDHPALEHADRTRSARRVLRHLHRRRLDRTSRQSARAGEHPGDRSQGQEAHPLVGYPEPRQRPDPTEPWLGAAWA